MENTLFTDRLEIRPIHKNDAEDIFAYRSNAAANQYQDFVPKNIDEIHNFISSCAEELDEVGTWFQLAISLKGHSMVIGDIGLNFIDEDQVEIGCTIARDHQEDGYATEAFMTVIDFLFQTLEKHRIIASIDPRNVASEKLLKRIGFRKEAHFVQSYLQNDEWLDDVQYGLLHSEWS